MVVNFDARTLPSGPNQPSPARFTIAAHDGAACALDVNSHIRGCLATAGTDKMVKIWNVQGEGERGGKRQVSLVAGRDLGLVGFLRAYVHHMRRGVLIFIYLGRGILGGVVAGRPINTCGGRLESQVADLGRGRELWCAQGFRYETRRSGARVKREKDWWRHQCCRRRRG